MSLAILGNFLVVTLDGPPESISPLILSYFFNLLKSFGVNISE